MPYPVDVTRYKVTAGYGIPGKLWSSGFHPGVDQGCPVGTPVFAVQDGKVIANKWGSDYGVHFVVDQKAMWVGAKRHPGWWAVYAHLSKSLVRPGQTIKRGQLIGYTGNTGKSTGPHIHYEMRNGQTWRGSKPVNPSVFLNA